MAVGMTRIPADYHRRLRENHDFELSNDHMPSVTNMVFGFLDGGEELFNSFTSDETRAIKAFSDHDDDSEDKNNSANIEETTNYWEKQHQLLQATLYSTSSLETRIRNSTKEALKTIETTGATCVCDRTSAAATTNCRNCLIREVSIRLQNDSYNSAICRTKWRSSQDIPSGNHTFLDVVDNSSIKGEVRVIIELNFWAEFEMARGSGEYNRLVHQLPEVFVGKVERMQSVIKIICSAAKKCMKEKKMHMGPWRKCQYMQAKWLSRCDRTKPVCTDSDSHKLRYS